MKTDEPEIEYLLKYFPKLTIGELKNKHLLRRLLMKQLVTENINKYDAKIIKPVQQVE